MNMRRRLADIEPGTQLYTQTEAERCIPSGQADSYAMTINGVIPAIRTTTTSRVWRAGMVRLSPTVAKRAAKAVYR